MVLQGPQARKTGMKRRNPKRAVQYKTPRYREILERVGANVRKLREARGLTQEEFAFQCGDMSTSMLRTIEGGRVQHHSNNSRSPLRWT